VKGVFLKEKIPIIIASSIGGALVLIGLIAVYCSRNRLGKRGRRGLANIYQSYQHPSAPAPAGDLHQVRGYHDHGGMPMYTKSCVAEVYHSSSMYQYLRGLWGVQGVFLHAILGKVFMDIETLIYPCGRMASVLLIAGAL
jgi:hypothetical protein